MKIPAYSNNMTVLEFVQTVNKFRLMNKNSWYGAIFTVENKTVRIKGYNTWLQIFEIDGIRQANTMDISVKQFKINLETAFK